MTKPAKTTGPHAELGATIPVVAAPMAGGPSTPALVTAAAQAGGLGFLAAGYKTPDLLADQIAQVRIHTARFGVNLFAPNPVPIDPAVFAAYVERLRPLAAGFGIDLTDVDPVEDDDAWEAKIDLLVHDPVPVVSFTFGLPLRSVVDRLHRAGTRLLQTVTTPEEAVQAASIGVDGLIVQSWRAGGHSGTLDPRTPPRREPLTDLIRATRDVTALPLWAAGGICTTDEVTAVIDAGAEAAIVGTLLLRTPESGASATYKRALADAARTETVVTTAFSGRPARALENHFVASHTQRAPLGYPAVHHLTSPIRKAAAAAGDSDNINIWAGTGYRSATTAPAADVLRRLAGHATPQ